MFRAGKLAELEDIRELALTKIVIKMQCHARRLLVKTIYDGKKLEKKGLYSVQHNIRLYLTCRVSGPGMSNCISLYCIKLASVKYR